MNALMLVIALFAGGELRTLVFEVPTLAQCEAERPAIIKALAEAPPEPGTSRPDYIAVVCAQPVKVLAV